MRLLYVLSLLLGGGEISEPALAFWGWCFVLCSGGVVRMEFEFELLKLKHEGGDETKLLLGDDIIASCCCCARADWTLASREERGDGVVLRSGEEDNGDGLCGV